MIHARIRRPLRWLWAFIGSLIMFALAGLTGVWWVAIGAPFVAVLFLTAPPLGVFKHDETPQPRTGLALLARESEDLSTTESGVAVARYTLSLQNDGDVDAEDFSVRLLIPEALAPRGGPVQPLGRILRGQIGRHWFIETTYDATALTFRTRLAPDDDLVCHAGAAIEIAELHFSPDRNPHGTTLAYQVSGGSAKAALGQVTLL